MTHELSKSHNETRTSEAGCADMKSAHLLSSNPGVRACKSLHGPISCKVLNSPVIDLQGALGPAIVQEGQPLQLCIVILPVQPSGQQSSGQHAAQIPK